MKIINHPGGLVKPRLIAALTAATEPLSPQTLSDLLGVSTNTVSSSMRTLVKKKIASVVKIGRHPRYSLAPPAEDNYIPTIPGARLVRIVQHMQAGDPPRKHAMGKCFSTLEIVA